MVLVDWTMSEDERKMFLCVHVSGGVAGEGWDSEVGVDK